MSIETMLLKQFKNQFEKGFKIKQVERAEIFANKLKDEVIIKAIGNNGGIPIEGQSDPKKLSENSTFTDMFMSRIEKLIKDVKKIDASVIKMNFKLGNVKADIYYIDKNDQKTSILNLTVIGND